MIYEIIVFCKFFLLYMLLLQGRGICCLPGATLKREQEDEAATW